MTKLERNTRWRSKNQGKVLDYYRAYNRKRGTAGTCLACPTPCGRFKRCLQHRRQQAAIAKARRQKNAG